MGTFLRLSKAPRISYNLEWKNDVLDKIRGISNHETKPLIREGKFPLETGKRVLVWTREDLLGQVIELILDSRQDLQITRFFARGDIEALLQHIQQECPEAVILHEDESLPLGDWALRIIRECPNVRVIAVSPLTNTVSVYRREEVHLNRAADLLNIIGM